ncbi:hypothetical protein GE061_016337 [Apolygus lucorum]|uniref:Peptidase S1 domain-containing protein n=1 Tax=Apolygus lucorum TaxID=248454 RepID=A0A6A4K7Q8_APOLU|nr:hypothetical protein GE061_016337 [Apolygus lucorum]
MLVEVISWLAVFTASVRAVHNVDFSRWSVNIVRLEDGKFICDATLVTYKDALTSCECATQTDFIFPEFFRKVPEQYNLTTRRFEHQYGYQAQRVKQFVLHPKCTSHNLITGFFSFNYAIAESEKPFQDFEKAILPVDLPTLDYAIVNFTIWQALSDHQSCGILVWNGAAKNPAHSETVVLHKTCEEILCNQLGRSCPLSLEEKGVLCLRFYKQPDDYDNYDDDYVRSLDYIREDALMRNISLPDKVQRSKKKTLGDSSRCTGEILSGAPLICYGFFMGITAPGVCTTEVPFLVARIEPALEFVYKHIEGERSSAAALWPLPTLTIFPVLKILSISQLVVK